MKKVKSVITGLLGCVILVSSSMLVMAAEQHNSIICVEGQAEQSMQMETCALPTVIGETKVVSEDEGGILTVTLIDAFESVTRGTSKTSTRSFLFEYTTILGIKLDAYRVNLSCDWIDDGDNSKIIALNGNVEELGGGYSCEWTDSSYAETFCWLELQVTKGTVTGTYRFTSAITMASDKYIIFDYAYLG